MDNKTGEGNLARFAFCIGFFTPEPKRLEFLLDGQFDAHYFEARGIYSIARELVALPAYWLASILDA